MQNTYLGGVGWGWMQDTGLSDIIMSATVIVNDDAIDDNDVPGENDAAAIPHLYPTSLLLPVIMGV